MLTIHSYSIHSVVRVGLPRDDSNSFVVTVKHIVKNATGQVKRGGNLCFNFAKRFMRSHFNCFLGYYCSLLVNGRCQVIDDKIPLCELVIREIDVVAVCETYTYVIKITIYQLATPKVLYFISIVLKI